MTVLGDFVKFSLFPLLLVILGTDSAQKCGISQFQNPLTIYTSPGFFSGAIQHVSNQECTESGTCLHIPRFCPHSSCCVSSTPANIPANILIPASLSTSKCGCWDSVRKICKPLSSFVIGYSACDSQNGVQMESKIRISSGSRQIISKICKGNTAVVELNADYEGRALRFQITTLACIQNLRRGGRQGDLESDLGTLDVDLVGGDLLDLAGFKKHDIRSTLTALLNQKNKTSGKTTESSGRDDRLGKLVPFKCDNAAGNESFLMSSSFLSGAINNFLGQNTGTCSGQGSCGISTSDCQSTSCCLVSTSGDGNSSGDSCECLRSGLGTWETELNSCLVHHRVYKVLSTVCTETGERVWTSLSVRLPSSGFNRCISGGASWEMSSVNYVINENGNLEAVIEVRKCILSGANQEYLEIEQVVKAELSIDIVSKMLNMME